MASRGSTSDDRTGHDYSERSRTGNLQHPNKTTGKPKTVTIKGLTSQSSGLWCLRDNPPHSRRRTTGRAGLGFPGEHLPSTYEALASSLWTINTHRAGWRLASPHTIYRRHTRQ